MPAAVRARLEQGDQHRDLHRQEKEATAVTARVSVNANSSSAIRGRRRRGPPGFVDGPFRRRRELSHSHASAGPIGAEATLSVVGIRRLHAPACTHE